MIIEEEMAMVWMTRDLRDHLPQQNQSLYAAHVAQRFLDSKGVYSEIVGTVFLVGNPAAAVHMQMGSPPEEWPPNARWHGRHPGDGNPHWLVVTDTHLVDLSFAQFSEPNYGINITTPLATSLEGVSTPETASKARCWETTWDDGVWMSAVDWVYGETPPPPIEDVVEFCVHELNVAFAG